MPIRRGVVASSITELPTVTIGAVTNFTESRATFNATVSANYQSTTVQFQYSKQSNFSTIDGTVTATGSPVTGQSVAVSYSITGLPINDNGQLYYVRAVVANGIGTVTSSSTSFTTWKKYITTWTSNTNFTVPTISGVAPAALPVVLVLAGGGGGGGSDAFAAGGGGGGGGYRSATNVAFTGTSGYLSIIVGGAGAGGTSGNPGSTTNGGDGGFSQISGTNFPTYTAGGGEGGKLGAGRGGNVGSGDNPAYTGGSAYISTVKLGTSYGGGGAGTNGNGGNASSTASGDGGAGNGLGFGSGGAGGIIGTHGSPTSGYGLGGNGGTNPTNGAAGTAGAVSIHYYGPV